MVSCYNNFLLHSLAAAWCHLINYAIGPSTLKPFQNHKYELPVGEWLLNFYMRDTRKGGSRMKALARWFVWWPGVDDELVKLVKECDRCQLIQHNPVQAPVSTSLGAIIISLGTATCWLHWPISVADPAMGPRGPGPPLFSYQNINIHYCVHAFFREYH